MLILMFVSNAIVSMFTTNATSQNQQTIIDQLRSYPAYIVIVTIFIAPILEELIFRVSIYKIIGKYKWLFIILSGLIFGSMHVLGEATTLIDYLYIIPYGIPGSFFAYTLYKSNNSCVPISLHIIHNTFALLLQFIAM